MSHPVSRLSCGFIVGMHTEGSWKGFEKPCGDDWATVKDPRSERYDDGLCPKHLAVVLAELEEYRQWQRDNEAPVGYSKLPNPLIPLSAPKLEREVAE